LLLTSILHELVWYTLLLTSILHELVWYTLSYWLTAWPISHTLTVLSIRPSQWLVNLQRCPLTYIDQCDRAID